MGKLQDRDTGTMNGQVGVMNVLCKANTHNRINRRICRNNCKQWLHYEKRCRFGYK